MNTTDELEKCKNNIVYFVENYIIDANGNHIKLTDGQINFLRNIYKNKIYDYI